MNQPNKEEQSSAEVGEGRRRAMDTTGPGSLFRKELLPVGSKSRKNVVKAH